MSGGADVQVEKALRSFRGPDGEVVEVLRGVSLHVAAG